MKTKNDYYLKSNKNRILRTTVQIILLILIINVISSCVDGNQLILDVSSDIYENEEFRVSVYIINNSGFPEYQIDVEVFFNNIFYEITYESPEILLLAPDVEESSNFNISAKKNGYITNNTSITILNKLKLLVYPDSYTIDENKQFSVVVNDEQGNPIEGVTVSIDGYYGNNGVSITNDNGRLWLISPEDRDEITIRAQKKGYIDDITTIRINKNLGLIDHILLIPYFPFIIAFIFLILAVLYVVFKEGYVYDDINLEKYPKEFRRARKHRFFSFFLQKRTNPEYEENGDDDEDEKLTKGPKVEEIRIKRNKKEKEIISVDLDKNKYMNITHGETFSNEKDEWFHGRDDFRYMLDKLSNKNKNKDIDKWYEGTMDLGSKIDEKLKKKDKKK